MSILINQLKIRYEKKRNMSQDRVRSHHRVKKKNSSIRYSWLILLVYSTRGNAHNVDLIERTHTHYSINSALTNAESTGIPLAAERKHRIAEGRDRRRGFRQRSKYGSEQHNPHGTLSLCFV